VFSGALAKAEAEAEPSASASGVTFQRLLLEVYDKDVRMFREYCRDVEEWQPAVHFLDEVDGGGWDLLDLLIHGSSSCENLIESPFLAET
jgi:hypothetical protein